MGNNKELVYRLIQERNAELEEVTRQINLHREQHNKYQDRGAQLREDINQLQLMWQQM